jgi:hypothetical protein
MKTEQEEVKHTPLPWKADDKNWLSINDGTDGFGNLVCQTNGKGREESDANRAFILEACNNYYSLKSQLQQLQEENKHLVERMDKMVMLMD